MNQIDNFSRPLYALKQSILNIEYGKSTGSSSIYAYLKDYTDIAIRPYYTKTKELTTSAKDVSYQLSTNKVKIRTNRIRMDIACNNPKRFIKKVADFQKKIDLKIAQLAEEEEKSGEALKEAVSILGALGINAFVKSNENTFKAYGDGFKFNFFLEDGFMYPTSVEVNITNNLKPLHLYRLIDQVNLIQNGPKEAGVFDGAQDKEGARNKMEPERG